MQPECSSPCSQKPGTLLILIHKNPVYNISYFLITICFIWPPSTPMSSKWSLFCRPRYGNHACIYFLPQTCHIPRQLYPPLFDHSNNIWRVTENVNFLIVQFSPSYNISPRLRLKYILLPLSPLEHPSTFCSLSRQTKCQIARKIIIL